MFAGALRSERMDAAEVVDTKPYTGFRVVRPPMRWPLRTMMRRSPYMDNKNVLPEPGRLLTIAAEHMRGLHSQPHDDCRRCRQAEREAAAVPATAPLPEVHA